MSTLAVAGISATLLILAYFVYGRWLARRVFVVDERNTVPSHEFEDGCDYVPTSRAVVFGHHFTSIAGTGPIVGPALAVLWGWLPAVIWILFGSIFIGAVHDFGTLMISLRNRGQTVGEIAGSVISPRARVLFLLILFFALLVVLAIFGLVIASVFKLYPGSVLAVWGSLPLAIIVGHVARHPNAFGGLTFWSIVSLVVLYALVVVGSYWVPIRLPERINPVVIWTIILLVYCFIASVIPVQVLLQPRDYINSHQLITALFLLIVGLSVAGWQGANLVDSAPAIMPVAELPAGAPWLFPFLFITIACGAVSGFHCLVSSGTSSKQVANERDALSIGYGSMLLEAFLAIVVVLACCAGTGMGKIQSLDPSATVVSYQHAVDADTGMTITGRAAWNQYYGQIELWDDYKLGQLLGAFVDGGANFLGAIGIPLQLGVGLIAVLVACFAATTLDSATRLQRYVVQELAGTLRIKPLQNKYAATAFPILLSIAIAMMPKDMQQPNALAWANMGQGGLLLWPLFGATNQLLAGLALLVVAVWLKRQGRPVGFIIPPTLIMLFLPMLALVLDLTRPNTGFIASNKWTLVVIGTLTVLLQVWIVIEGWYVWNRLSRMVAAGKSPG